MCCLLGIPESIGKWSVTLQFYYPTLALTGLGRACPGTPLVFIGSSGAREKTAQPNGFKSLPECEAASSAGSVRGDWH